MIWTGAICKKLGLIEPAGSTEVVLQVVPQDTGLQVWFWLFFTSTKRTENLAACCETNRA
jgi:hypothetical protein